MIVLQALALGRRDKGKAAARRGRKAYGLQASLEAVAGLSNDGGATMSFALRGKWRRGRIGC